MRTLVRIRRGIRSAFAKLESHWAKPLVRLMRWAFPALLLVYLGYRLTLLGWAEVWNARPGGLGFYAVVFLQFYVQPLTDLVIYRNLLRPGGALPFQVLLRKRYINTFLDYSGELYFFFWARKNLKPKRGMLFHAVKDTNVLSASAALVMIWLTLLAVVVSGGVKLPAFANNGLWTYVVFGSLPLVLALALFFGGRKVTMLSRGQVLSTFAAHMTRCIVQLMLEFMVWWLSGALPTATACLQFVALRVLITRLPFVPNKDLVFMGVGIAVAGVMDVSGPKVAAALGLMTVIGLLQNLTLVGLPWFFEQFQIRRRAGANAM